MDNDLLNRSVRKGTISAAVALRTEVSIGSDIQCLSESTLMALATSSTANGEKVESDAAVGEVEKTGGGASDVEDRTAATLSSKNA